MKLGKKKFLASKVFNVGKSRVLFVEARLEEIKEAITKEDIRGLKKDGAIMIKDIKGKRTKPRNKKRRTPGNIRKNVKKTKREYMTLTRKFRKYVLELKNKNLLTREHFLDIRKKIRNRYFKSKAQLKEYIQGLEE